MTFDFQPSSAAAAAAAAASAELSAPAVVNVTRATGHQAEHSLDAYLRLTDRPDDTDLLVEVTGLSGVTRATWADAARLAHNLRQRRVHKHRIFWLLELLEGSYDRLHPGPMLANPFLLVRISLASTRRG